MSWLIRILLLVAAVTPLRAADSAWVLPPMDGSLSGKLESSALAPGAPALQWRADVVKTTHDVRHAIITMEGAGTRIRGEAEINLVNGITTWKVTEGYFDLERWHDVITHWIPAATGFEITGTLSVTSNGVVHDGHPTGEFVVSLQGATIGDSSAGWKLEGVSLNGRFAADAAARELRTIEPLTLGIRTITSKRFGARNLSVTGRLRNASTFDLTAARLEIAGGDMVAAPTTIELQPLRMAIAVTLNRIGLQDVAALVPTALQSARGRVDGSMEIGWNSGGLALGKGHLILRSDEHADVTLKPFPGLFTSSLPRWMQWLLKLPDWMVNWSVPALKKAELGQAPIEAQSLEVTFWPQPDAEGRTAIVHLTGVPHGARSRTPVDITANVYGSLTSIVHLGTNTKLSFGVH